MLFLRPGSVKPQICGGESEQRDLFWFLPFFDILLHSAGLARLHSPHLQMTGVS